MTSSRPLLTPCYGMDQRVQIPPRLTPRRNREGRRERAYDNAIFRRRRRLREALTHDTYVVPSTRRRKKANPPSSPSYPTCRLNLSDFPVLAIKKIFGFFDILVNVALTQLMSIIDCYWVAATNGQYYPHLTQ